MSEYTSVAKLVMIGNSGVGKSALILRYTNDEFDMNYNGTIGVDFSHKIITFSEKKVKLQIWDTAGQPRFQPIIRSYYNMARFIAICFSVEDRSSFSSVRQWIEDIGKYKKNEEVTLFLIGTKIDLTEQRVIFEEEATMFAERYNMEYLETTSKVGFGVNECFDKIAKRMLENEENKVRIDQDAFDEMDKTIELCDIGYYNKIKKCC